MLLFQLTGVSNWNNKVQKLCRDALQDVTLRILALQLQCCVTAALKMHSILLKKSYALLEGVSINVFVSGDQFFAIYFIASPNFNLQTIHWNNANCINETFLFFFGDYFWSICESNYGETHIRWNRSVVCKLLRFRRQRKPISVLITEACLWLYCKELLFRRTVFMIDFSAEKLNSNRHWWLATTDWAAQFV